MQRRRPFRGGQADNCADADRDHGAEAIARGYPGARTSEQDGFQPRVRGIYDDRGRLMVVINWNTDMGDGWEWSNAEEYPDYIKYTSMAYRMGINEVVYALTH